MPSKQKMLRQGKERGIMVGELVESMECVKQYFLKANHTLEKEKTYQLL
jgi:hypothetical protein